MFYKSKGSTKST